LEERAMIGDKRTYTLGEKSFRRQIAQGTWVGSVFGDHGRTMEITQIGPRYKDGHQWVIEVVAVEIEKNKTEKIK
jgi:hypothetical protein